MQTAVDDYLTPHHRTLRLIANTAGVLAYLVLAFFVIRAGLALAANLYLSREELFDPLLRQQASAWRYINLGLAFLEGLVNGVVCWMLLIGLSLGLRMVVETDVNRRLGDGEVGDE